MEAIEFLKEAYRFCSQYPICFADCPLRGKCIFEFGDYGETQKETEQKIENAVAVIEQWSKEHPIITNKMKFKEVFGDKAIYAISSPNVQALKDWLDEPYKESEHED